MERDFVEDGPLAGWHPAGVALGVLVAGLVAYMAIGSAAVIALLVLGGTPLADAATLGPALLAERSAAIFAGNAIGLALGLGLLAVLVARALSTRPWSFLRVRTVDWRAAGLGIVGLVAVMPAIMWLGELNEGLPLPEFIRTMEEDQLALLEAALSGQGSLVLNLLLVALTPALFEEVFFRGLVQRNLERAWGAAAGIAATGIVFGLFHLRLTQALPLMVLGIYLAYLAWRTGSLWVPVAVHFANNALALVFSAVAWRRMNVDLNSLEASVIPWYVVSLGIVLFAGVIIVLQRRGRRHVAQGMEHSVRLGH